MQPLLKQVSCSQHLILNRFYKRGGARGHSVLSFAFLSLWLHCANLDVARTFLCHCIDVFLVPECRDDSLHHARWSLLQSMRLNCLCCAPAAGLNWWLSGRSISMKKGPPYLSWTCCPKYQSKVSSVTSGTVPGLPGFGHGTAAPRAQPAKPTPNQQQLRFTSCVISQGSQTLCACRHPAFPTCCQHCCSSWETTCTALFVLQSWRTAGAVWRTSPAASGVRSGSSGSRHPSRTWSKCCAQKNELLTPGSNYLHQVAISKVVLIKILCYTVCNFIEYKH